MKTTKEIAMELYPVETDPNGYDQNLGKREAFILGTRHPSTSNVVSEEAIKTEWDKRSNYIKSSKFVNTEVIFNFFKPYISTQPKQPVVSEEEMRSRIIDTWKELGCVHIEREEELAKLLSSVSLSTQPKQVPTEQKEAEFKCQCCGCKINSGEHSVFGCCDTCYETSKQQHLPPPSPKQVPSEEQGKAIKLLSSVAKSIADESLIDDDVTGGSIPEPEKSWVTKIYQSIDLLESLYPNVEQQGEEKK